MAARKWEVFRSIAREEKNAHKQFLGARTRTAEASPSLNQAVTLATELLNTFGPQVYGAGARQVGSAMMFSNGAAAAKPDGGDAAFSHSETVPREAVESLETAMLLLNASVGDVVSEQRLFSSVAEIDTSGFYTSPDSIAVAARAAVAIDSVDGGYTLRPLP